MSDPGDDFRLADLMTVGQVIERHQFLTRAELLAAMRSRKLRHWPKGRERLVTERWLQDWIRAQLRGGEGDPVRDMPAVDAPGRRRWDGATDPRMTPESEENEIAARLLAQSISRKPRKKSLRAR